MSLPARRSPGPTARSAGAIRRWAALLLAVIWSAAPALAALHAEAEIHRFCAEHQALEEAQPGGGVVEGGRGAELAVGGVSSAPGDLHESCAFGRCCRFGQTLAPLVLAVGPDVPTPVVVMPVAQLPPPARAIFRLAPKTSPPV